MLRSLQPRLVLCERLQKGLLLKVGHLCLERNGKLWKFVVSRFGLRG